MITNVYKQPKHSLDLMDLEAHNASQWNKTSRLKCLIFTNKTVQTFLSAFDTVYKENVKILHCYYFGFTLLVFMQYNIPTTFITFHVTIKFLAQVLFRNV